MKPLTVLRDSLHFFRLHLLDIARLCLPLVFLEALATHLLQRQLGENAGYAYSVMLLLFYPLYTAALILYLDTRSQGQAVAKRALFARALQLWPRMALLVLLGSLLIMAGLALLILPGLWLMLKLAFADFYVVLRGRPVLQAMRDSASLTTGRLLTLLVCVLWVMAVLWLIEALLLMAFPEAQPGVAVMIDTFSGFLQLFITVVLYRLFMLSEAQSAA